MTKWGRWRISKVAQSTHSAYEFVIGITTGQELVLSSKFAKFLRHSLVLHGLGEYATLCSCADVNHFINNEGNRLVDEICFGIRRKWLLEKRIVVYSLRLLNTTTIRIWANEALSTIHAWDKERPYLALHDLSKPGIGLSYILLAQAYLMNPAITTQGSLQLRELMEAHPDFRVCLAVVLAPNYRQLISEHSMKKFINSESGVTASLFFNRVEALHWLTEVGIPDYKRHLA